MWIYVFLLLVLTEKSQGNITEVLVYKKNEPAGCINSIKLAYCYEALNERRTYYYYEEKVEIDSTCKPKISVRWYLSVKDAKTKNQFKEYRNKLILIIPSSYVKVGRYVLTVVVKERNVKTFSKSCELDYLQEPPEINFTPGRTQGVLAGSAFTIDISKSKYLPVASLKWTCNCINVDSPECSKVPCFAHPKGPKFSLNMNACYQYVEFIVEVTYGTHIMTDNCLIYTHVSQPTMKMTLERTCRKSRTYKCNDFEKGVFSSKNDIVHQAQCSDNCDTFESLELVWEIREVVTTHLSGISLRVTSGTKKMTIPKNSLQPDKRYFVFVKSEGNFIEFFIIRTLPKYTQPTCRILPTSGISLETLFEMTCDVTDYFKLHLPFVTMYQWRTAVSDKTDIMIGSSHLRSRFYLEGYEKPRLTVSARFHDEYLYQIVFCEWMTVQMEVKDLNPTVLEEQMSLMEKHAQEGDTPLVCQLARSILKGLKLDKLDDQTTTHALTRIMKTLEKVPVHTLFDYKILTTTIQLLLSFNRDDQKFKDELVDTCKVASTVDLSKIAKSKYGHEQEKGVYSYSKRVDECANYLIKIGEEELNSSMPGDEYEYFPEEIESDYIHEDYANYDDKLDSIDSKLKKLEAAAVLHKTTISTQAYFPIGGAKENGDQTTPFHRKVTKNYGKDLNEVDIEVTGAKVTTSNNMERDYGDNVVSAVVTSFKKNFIDNDVLATRVVDINFYKQENGSTVPIYTDFHIVFDMNLDEGKFNRYTVFAPGDINLWWCVKMDYKMNVHRLKVNKGSNCFVKFKDFIPGTKFQVVFKRDIRPKFQDFYAGATTIDSGNTDSHILVCPFNISKSKDHFVYVAVFPHPDMAESSDGRDIAAQYVVQFSEQSCVTFNNIIFEWKPTGCKVNFYYQFNKPKLECICNHTSLYAGTNIVIASKLDEILVVKFTVEHFTNYIIFIHVAVVFGLYCIALAFSPNRSVDIMGKEKVIFLTDNMKNDRYAYFLVVKTGNLAFSGTTSNVVVNLYGALGESKPHLLNYPDPDKRFLQRDNEDWFILTNDRHLGDLQYIEIWIDSIGYRPSWYCDNIVIIDLQDRSEWFFKVERWLSLANQNSYIVQIKGSKMEVSKVTLATNIQKNTRLYVGAENTWNIFSKLQDYKLAYNERLTVLLSMIYTIYTCTILFLKPPQWKMSDAFGYETLRFEVQSLPAVFISSIVCSLINYPFVYFFRNSAKSESKFSIYTEVPLFSRKVNKVIWILVCSWISICSVYLILFGFSVAHMSSILWSKCCFLAIVFDAVVNENVFLILSKILTQHYRKVSKRHYSIERLIVEVERQRKILYRKFGELLMRPYFKKHYNKLTWDTYTMRKKIEQQRSDVIALVKSMGLYLVFLVLLYILTFLGGNQFVSVSNKTMKKMVTGRFNKNHMLLDSVNTTEDVYSYINNTIIPIIHPTRWYASSPVSDAGLMADFSTKILGVCQLRQQRGQQRCEYHELLSKIPFVCNNDEPKIFGYFGFSAHHSISRAVGQLDTYSGDGYVIHLGRTLHNSRYILNILKLNRWININTKVLFIEFWTYNANYNLFNAVRVMIERDLSGRYVTSTKVTTAHLIYENKLMEIVTYPLLGTLLLVICILLGNGIWLIMKKGRSYFENLWNGFDSLLVIQSFAVVVLILLRQQEVLMLLKQLEESNHNNFVDYFHAIDYLEINNVVMGSLVCMGTLRLWKFIRFSKVFQLVEHTMRLSMGGTLCVALYQGVANIMFAAVFFAHLRWMTYDYSQVTHALMSLFLVSLNLKRGRQRKHLHFDGTLIYVYYSLFMIITAIFYSMYSTIFMIAYSQSKVYFSNMERMYNLKNYVIDETRYFYELVKKQNRLFRLKGGEDLVAHKYVTPKAPTKRYADSFVLSKRKILVMRVISILVVRRILKYRKKERDLLEDDVYIRATIRLLENLRNKTIKEHILQQSIFFVGKDPADANKRKFVSNYKMLQMEYAVEKLVRHDVEDLESIAEMDNIKIIGDADRLEYYKNVLEMILATISHIDVEIK